MACVGGGTWSVAEVTMRGVLGGPTLTLLAAFARRGGPDTRWARHVGRSAIPHRRHSRGRPRRFRPGLRWRRDSNTEPDFDPADGKARDGTETLRPRIVERKADPIVPVPGRSTWPTGRASRGPVRDGDLPPG